MAKTKQAEKTPPVKSKNKAKAKLVIVESPAKAKTIAKLLGRGYKVEASNGHVRDLPKSQIGVDVEQDFEPKYITIRGRGEILERLRKEAKGSSRIYLATDPDREGEAISWHLANVLGVDPESPCRVEFHEITEKAIKSAMKQPRPVDMELVNAQQARRVLDRLVGYKISPLLWQKVKKGLSAGRVQSVATRMIVDREREIDQFIPEEYWTIVCKMRSGKQSIEAKLSQLDGKKAEIAGQESATAAVQRLREAQYTVSSVKWSEKKKNPMAPFTTSNLQQEAARKLGFTTQKSMQIAQQLYEGVELIGEGTVGLVTYIRTDSTRVSEEALESVRNYIATTYGAAHVPSAPNEYGKGKRKVQDAHEAIRPTDILRTPESIVASLSRDQMKLYKLVFERFVASQMMGAVYDVFSVEITGGGAQLHFGGMHKKFAGFTAVYEEGQDDADLERESNLPTLMEGDEIQLQEILPEQHFTQPTPRYTEASLVRALEEKGIGRPSTYAPTIGTILARGYVAREGKRLHPTELGLIVTDLMKEYFSDIVDIAFTADMEDELDKVEDGGQWKQILRDFYPDFKQTLEIAENSIEKVEVQVQISDVPCEKCGEMMVIKMGRYGKFLACPGFPECKSTKAIHEPIGVPCPKCGKDILQRMSRKGRKFYGCEAYPQCDFVSWDMPVAQKCPVCGGDMVYKRDRKGEVFHVCIVETCRHREAVEQEAVEEG